MSGRRCLQSPVWKYFIRVSKTGATCNICFKFVAGGGCTSNFHKHLETNHHFSVRGKQLNILRTAAQGASSGDHSSLMDSVEPPSKRSRADVIDRLQSPMETSDDTSSNSSDSLSSIDPFSPTAKSSIQPKLRDILTRQLSFAGNKQNFYYYPKLECTF